MAPADTIVCVDCGGTCTRVPFEAPEPGWHAGDLVTYRCGDCADMWYLEVDEDDVSAKEAGARDLSVQRPTDRDGARETYRDGRTGR